jgi:hypothetical protein
MAQCQSKIFFPDDPAKPPQFGDCPRLAETTRRTSMLRGNKVITSVVKLCSKCAKMWDEGDIKAKAAGGSR